MAVFAAEDAEDAVVAASAAAWVAPARFTEAAPDTQSSTAVAFCSANSAKARASLALIRALKEAWAALVASFIASTPLPRAA